MDFVRHVLHQAGHQYAERITAAPVDGHWTGRDLASSLAGRDLGPLMVRVEQVEPGDVLFWDDTYSTGFPPRTITHVGIAVSKTQFVHRPTAARPVERASLTGFWASQFRCALSLPAIPVTTAPPTPESTQPQRPEFATLRMYANANGWVVDVRERLEPGQYQIFSDAPAWSGKLVRRG